jgi:hypothetical protein
MRRPSHRKFVWVVLLLCGCSNSGPPPDPYAGMTQEEMGQLLIENLKDGKIRFEMDGVDQSKLSAGVAPESLIEVEGEIELKDPKKSPVKVVTLAIVRRIKGRDATSTSINAELESLDENRWSFEGQLKTPKRPGDYFVIARDHGRVLAETPLKVR